MCALFSAIRRSSQKSCTRLQQTRTIHYQKLGPPPPGKSAALVPRAHKRVKMYDLDEALVMYKKFRDIVKLRDLLEMSQGHVLNLHALGKLRGRFKLARDRRLSSYPVAYPGVVKLTKDADGWEWLEFTDEAEDLVTEKARYMREVHEQEAVKCVRKILMMSQTRRLLVARLHRLKNLLFLPHDVVSFLRRYPQYFHLVESTREKVVELVEWDDSLAVTYREQKLKDNSLELDELMGDTNPYAFCMAFPKGFPVRRKVREYYEDFQKIPFQSPYELCRTSPNSIEAEKRNIAIVHELLSMFVEKRANITELLCLRSELMLKPRLRFLIERHQGIFYTSYKEDTFTVFLKEAYCGMRLIDRSPLLDFRDQFIQLCLVEPEAGKKRRFSASRSAIEQRVRDINGYKTLGRMIKGGRIVTSGVKKQLRWSLSSGHDVEVRGDDEGMIWSKPHARLHKILEEGANYNIVQLEQSLDEFKDEINQWPSEDEYDDWSDPEW